MLLNDRAAGLTAGWDGEAEPRGRASGQATSHAQDHSTWHEMGTDPGGSATASLPPGTASYQGTAPPALLLVPKLVVMDSSLESKTRPRRWVLLGWTSGSWVGLEGSEVCPSPTLHGSSRKAGFTLGLFVSAAEAACVVSSVKDVCLHWVLFSMISLMCKHRATL